MEVCVLKFSSADGADEALKQVINAEGDRNPWLYDVGVIKRPLLGRMSIRATFADEPVLKEGDVKSSVADAGAMTGYLVGSLVGPLHAEMAALQGLARGSGAGKALEKQLLRTDEIKRNLPRDSSALVLVAPPEINDRMVQMFAKWSPEVIRKDVAQEVVRQLETFQQKTMQDIAQQAAAH
jgi:uncharacterized membrane protein